MKTGCLKTWEFYLRVIARLYHETIQDSRILQLQRNHNKQNTWPATCRVSNCKAVAMESSGQKRNNERQDATARSLSLFGRQYQFPLMPRVPPCMLSLLPLLLLTHQSLPKWHHLAMRQSTLVAIV